MFLIYSSFEGSIHQIKQTNLNYTLCEVILLEKRHCFKFFVYRLYNFFYLSGYFFSHRSLGCRRRQHMYSTYIIACDFLRSALILSLPMRKEGLWKGYLSMQSSYDTPSCIALLLVYSEIQSSILFHFNDDRSMFCRQSPERQLNCQS